MHGALSCGDDTLRPEFAAQLRRWAGGLRKRFRRAKVEGDLPETVDEDALEHLVQTLNFGLTLQASTGVITLLSWQSQANASPRLSGWIARASEALMQLRVL